MYAAVFWEVGEGLADQILHNIRDICVKNLRHEMKTSTLL